MIVRTLGLKFKFCRLYEDDVFGILNMRPKPSHKNLNVIYKDLYKNDFYFKKLLKQAKIFIIKIRRFFQKFSNKFFYKINALKKNLKIIKDIKIFLNYLFFFSKKTPINILLLFLYLKQFNIKFYISNFKQSKIFIKKKRNLKFKFNYRVDEGKPKREKKKLKLYSRRLLTRHRLRFFASRITTRQIRSYVKKNRNSKFLGMYFIWKIETRVDTILYRLNLQANTFFIRQYIKHVGLFVNDIFLNLPSFRLKFKDYLKLINKKQIFRFILYKFFKKLIFTSIPYYYEVNHRLMTMLFFFKPVNKMIFFPFEINIELLAGLGERF